MSISSDLERNAEVAIGVVNKFKRVANLPEGASSEKFTTNTSTKELQDLLFQRPEFVEFISLIADKEEVINTDYNTLFQIGQKYQTGTVLTPEEIKAAREARDDIREHFKELYTVAAEQIFQLQDKEEALLQERVRLQKLQQFGQKSVGPRLQEIENELNGITNEKGVLLEFFRAFSGEGLGEAINLIRGSQAARQAAKNGNNGQPPVNENLQNQEAEYGMEPRNSFETFLFKEGVPILEGRRQAQERIRNGENAEQVWKEHYDRMSRYFLSILFRDATKEPSPQYLDLGGDPTSLTYTVEGEVSKVDPLTITDKMKEDRRSGQELQDAAELKAVKEITDLLRSQIFSLKILISRDSAYISRDAKGKLTGEAYSLDGIMSFFPKGSTTDNNPWIWDFLFTKTGRLFWQDKDSKWIEDDESFSKKIYTAFREVLIRGRNADPNDGWKQKYLVPATGKTNPHKKDVLPLQLQDEHGRWNQFAVWAKSISTFKAVVPLKQAVAGKSKDYRLSNFYDVVNGLTPRDERQPPRRPDESAQEYTERIRANGIHGRGYKLDSSAAILGLKIADITGESDFQDCTTDKDGAPGRPEGLTTYSNIMNTLQQIRKYIVEDKGSHDHENSVENPTADTVGRINEGMSIDKALWTILDYFGYGGDTYTQHIIENPDPNQVVWGKITEEEAVKRNLNINLVGQGMPPDDASERYGSMVDHFLPVVKEMWKPDFDLRQLIKINYETGVIEQVNVDKIDGLIDSLRRLLDYLAATEASYAPIVPEQKKRVQRLQRVGEEIVPVLGANGQPEYDAVPITENPTGDMLAIVVQRVGSDGRLVQARRTREEHGRQVPVLGANGQPELMFDANGNPVYEQKRYVTRVNQIFPMHLQHLWRWVPAEMRDETARAHGAAFGEQTLDSSNFGKIPTKNWIFQIPADSFDDLPDPSQLVYREIVYRYLFALIYPGNQKSELEIADIASLFAIITDEGYERLEEGYWDGPIYFKGRQMAKGGLRKLAQAFEGRPKIQRFFEQSEQLLSKEVGSFKHRGIYTWDQAWQLMGYLNDKLTFEELQKIRGGLDQFFTAARPGGHKH